MIENDKSLTVSAALFHFGDVSVMRLNLLKRMNFHWKQASYLIWFIFI